MGFNYTLARLYWFTPDIFNGNHRMNPLPEHYQAWCWHQGHSPLQVQMESIEPAPLAADQVLIRNKVIGLNPVDWKVLGQLSAWMPGKIPGVDGAGIVVATGAGVSEQWLGQRVAYHQSLQADGSFAEFTPVACRALIRLPVDLDFASAASTPCPMLTAWLALEKIPLQVGRRVLISGAGGAVGSYLLQLALARGFVVTTLSHERHHDRLRALGADACLNTPPTDGQSCYAVIDCTGATTARALASLLDANGHLVCIQGRLEHWPTTAFSQSISLHEVALGALHQYGSKADWARLTDAGEKLLQAMARKELQAEPLLIRDFQSLPQWLETLRHRNFSGKPLVCL
jgi:NADPH2:quinone reductase